MPNSTDIDPPQLSDLSQSGEWPGARLADDESYDDLHLVHCDLRGQAADYVLFHRLLCADTLWTETQLLAAQFRDVRMTRCDLANARWPRAIFHRAEFLGCRLVGLQAGESHVQNVLLRECVATMASFRFGTFKRVRCEQCDLRQADFQGADLSGVVFVRCNLSDAQFSGATLTGTDLRGCTIENVRMGVAEAPGAIVDHAQAAYIAGLLGLVIKSEYEE